MKKKYIFINTTISFLLFLILLLINSYFLIDLKGMNIILYFFSIFSIIGIRPIDLYKTEKVYSNLKDFKVVFFFIIVLIFIMFFFAGGLLFFVGVFLIFKYVAVFTACFCGMYFIHTINANYLFKKVDVEVVKREIFLKEETLKKCKKEKLEKNIQKPKDELVVYKSNFENAENFVKFGYFTIIILLLGGIIPWYRIDSWEASGDYSGTHYCSLFLMGFTFFSVICLVAYMIFSNNKVYLGRSTKTIFKPYLFFLSSIYLVVGIFWMIIFKDLQKDSFSYGDATSEVTPLFGIYFYIAGIIVLLIYSCIFKIKLKKQKHRLFV